MSELSFTQKIPAFPLHLPQFLRMPFQISFLLSSVLALFLLVLYFPLQPEVPLFYSLPQPANYLVAKQWLIIFPVASFTITFLHMFFIRSLFHYEKIIPQLFAWFTVVIQVLFAFAFFRIIMIVT